MLSISKITSSKAAGSYYEKDDYYAKDDPNHQKQSQWQGKGAELLGLKGEVSKSDFEKILAGELPNGKLLGKNRDGELVHDAGRDLTFSAPKSVSIMALVYNDDRLINAHSSVVSKTIKIIERDFLKTRTIIDKQVIIEPVNNLVAATFKHFTSREQDPQLHTHTIIANATADKTGFWKCAFFDEIYNNKKLIGAIYRSELAMAVKNLGYEIEAKGKDSLFEIKNVPKELIEKFSTRSKQIREKAGEDASQKKLEATTLKTRVRKKEGENLKDVWQEKLDQLTSAQRSPIAIPKTPELLADYNNKYYLENRSQLAKEAVLYAIDHLSERKTVFTGNEIAEIALNDKLSLIKIDDINRKISQLSDKEDHLLFSKNNSACYTTKAALEREMAILDMMKLGQNKFEPILTKLSLTQYDNLTHNLNEGQKQSAELILTTKDQFIGIQGYAGVGKTFMLNSVNQIAKKEGKTLIGLSPTGIATKNLEAEAGIRSMTMQRFLAKYDGVAQGRGTREGRVMMQKEFKDKIVVIDESSMISSTQMKNLLTIAKELNFKIVFVGDVKQLDSVEAGIPFHEMQKNGLQTAKMDEILRQKNQNLKSAVYDLIDHKVKATFDKLDLDIKEVKEEKVVKTTIAEFLKLTPEQQSKTLILTPANETREKVNEIISNKLFNSRKNQNDNSNNKNDGIQNIYNNKNLTEIQKTKTYNYETDDVILFNKNLNIKKNQYCQVIGIDHSKNQITVRDSKSKEITFNPLLLKGKATNSSFEIFNIKEKIFRVGDKIAFNKAINNLRISNSNQATITDISHNKMTIKLESGRIINLAKNSNEIKHIDHSYAVTAHKAQGLTCDNVIAVVESHRKQLTTQKNFYVSISRAKHNATIITDHKQNTIKLLEKNAGIDMSAKDHQTRTQKPVKQSEHQQNTINHNQNFNQKQL